MRILKALVTDVKRRRRAFVTANNLGREYEGGKDIEWKFIGRDNHILV